MYTLFATQTPLENIENGTYILIGFYHLASDASAGKPTLVSWYKCDINLESIDTMKMKVIMRKPPVILDGNANDVATGEACLVMEVALSRRLNQFNMSTVRAHANRAVPAMLTAPSIAKTSTS